MRIIGIVGPIGGGKDTAAEYIAEKYGYEVISYRDIVKEETEKEGFEPDRKNMQIIATRRRHEIGEDFFSRKVVEKTENLLKKNKKVLLKEIRTLGDAEMPKEKFGKDFIIICIDSDSKIRGHRLVARGRTGDPSDIKEFEKQEKREIELGYRYWIKNADLTIKNNATKEDLYKKIDKIMEKLE